MILPEVSNFIHRNPDAIVQYMTTSNFLDRPFCYCMKAQELYDDWMNDAYNCPENGEMLLVVTFYVVNQAYPLENIGLNEDITFEDLLEQIGKGIKL